MEKVRGIRVEATCGQTNGASLLRTVTPDRAQHHNNRICVITASVPCIASKNSC